MLIRYFAGLLNQCFSSNCYHQGYIGIFALITPNTIYSNEQTRIMISMPYLPFWRDQPTCRSNMPSVVWSFSVIQIGRICVKGVLEDQPPRLRANIDGSYSARNEVTNTVSERAPTKSLDAGNESTATCTVDSFRNKSG